MNQLKAMVIGMGEPFQSSGSAEGLWFLPITYDCYGSEGRTHLVFLSKEEALKVQIGDEVMV